MYCIRVCTLYIVDDDDGSDNDDNKAKELPYIRVGGEGAGNKLNFSVYSKPF